jgi:hypothetical protein
MYTDVDAVDVDVVVDCISGAAKITGAVVSFPIRGPEGRSQGHRDVSFRFSGGFFSLFATVIFSFSTSFIGEVEFAPAVVPSTSLLLYPNIESPSTEL